MYFDDSKTMEELKAAYKRLALRHHPDMGGDLRVMQAVNAEYDAAFERLKAGSPKQTAEVAGDFRRVVDALLKIHGIEIELCGTWLWIGGDTYPVRAELRAAGCAFSGNKKKWYWHPPEERTRYGRKSTSMGWIRNKYGSKVIKGGHGEKAVLTA